MHPSLLALPQSGAEQTLLQASGSADVPRAGITGLGTEQSAEAPKFELIPESSPDSVSPCRPMPLYQSDNSCRQAVSHYRPPSLALSCRQTSNNA